MNNYWAFGEMQAANELLGDAAALQSRLADDGYLLVRGLLDRAVVHGVQRDVLGVLAAHGWVPAEEEPTTLAIGKPVREGDDDYFAAYDDVQRLESFHALAHEPALLGLMSSVLGPGAFPHPLKVARLVFPDNPEVSTPPHQDHPNNQGTPSLTAAWIPVTDCPRALGSLAILRGSHRFGVLSLAFHLGPGNRQAIVPDDVLNECTWVTADLAAGDVVLFPSLTVHAALNNATFNMRLSVDFRYQRQGEDLTDMVLHPHFGRLSWDDIYAGWQSDELKYYWQRLRFNVVPFDRDRFEAAAPTEDQVQELMAYEIRREMRHAFRSGSDTD